MSFSRQKSRIFALLAAIVCVLVVGGIPGSWMGKRAEPTKKTVQVDLKKDASLEVAIVARGAPHLGRVRAFHISNGVADLVGEITTDANGRGVLTNLSPGEHWIVADADSFSRASAMVILVSGLRHLDLALQPEHRLDVRVNDERGEPVPFAEVEVAFGDPIPVGAKADEQGVAQVGHLGESPWVVRVRASGYGEVERRGVPEGTELTVVVHRLGSLRVSVIDQDGARVADATVQISSAVLWPSRRAETDKDGTVLIGGLAEGAYALRAAKGDRASETEIAVSLERGAEKEVTLRLGAGASIAVRVVEDDLEHAPIRGAQVVVAEGGLSAFPIEGATGKDGRAILGPVAKSVPVIVTARSPGYVSKSVAVDPTSASAVEISLARAGTITGRVTDARGFPIAGATLVVVGTDFQGGPIDDDPRREQFRSAHFQSALGGSVPLVQAGELGVMPGPVPPIPHFSAPEMAPSMDIPRGTQNDMSRSPWVTKGDGTYTITPITPGRVRVLVRHPEFVEAESELVSVSPGGEARADIEMHGGGSLEGKVVDVAGRPIGRAHVTILATRGSMERSTRTGTDGSFAFASVPPELTILVSRADDPLQIGARVEVVVPEGKSKEITVTLPEARPPLRVVVTDDRDYPLSNAQVTALSIDPSSHLRSTSFTDARGEVSLNDAKGIALSLEVRSPGHAAKKIRVAPGQEKVVVALVPGEIVKGDVRDSHGGAIAGADITIYTEAGVRHARTDKKGLFGVGDLAPGPIRVVVVADGFAPVSKAMSVDASNGRRPSDAPRIEMEEEGIVEGVVVDAKGDPIAGARIAKDTVPLFFSSAPSTVRQAVSDAKGRFRLGSLPEGEVSIEAYVPDVGRAAKGGVQVSRGRTTDVGKIVVQGDRVGDKQRGARGGVAITLGETGGDVHDVVVVHVSEGSEAERAGIAPGDQITEVNGTAVHTIESARALLSGAVGDDVRIAIKRGETSSLLRVTREDVRR